MYLTIINAWGCNPTASSAETSVAIKSNTIGLNSSLQQTVPIPMETWMFLFLIGHLQHLYHLFLGGTGKDLTFLAQLKVDSSAELPKFCRITLAKVGPAPPLVLRCLVNTKASQHNPKPISDVTGSWVCLGLLPNSIQQYPVLFAEGPTSYAGLFVVLLLEGNDCG